MPTARGGAGAAVIGSRLYVVGGLAGNGSSLTTVESIDLAAPGGGWRTDPALTTPRDNLAVVAIGTTLLAAGGRTRLADGTTVDGTLASTEALTAGGAAWVAKAPMPTGRRSVTAQVVDGLAYVIGGEATTTNGAFIENQSYDLLTDTWSVVTALPQGRHGMASGVISGRIHVVGGGTVAGTSYSALHTVFAP
jgi:N-acetylneuraminic acid mutarotase